MVCRCELLLQKAFELIAHRLRYWTCCDISARLNTSKSTLNFWLKMIVFGNFRTLYRHFRTVKIFY